MTKRHLKLIAKLYLGTIGVQSDAGYDPEEVGMTEEDSDVIQSEMVRLGNKLCKGHPNNFATLEQIVNYVKDKYYE